MTAAQLLCLCCIGLLATAGQPTARPEREPTMNSSLSPLGMDCRIWNGTPIQRRPADGFVNATAMCQANGKRWAKFRESAQCEAYIEALAAEVRISAFALVESQRGGTGAGGETWIHPDLATELARWISPAFSVFVNRWFRSVVEAGQVSHVRDVQPAAQPIARPEPTTVLTAPTHWCRLVDDYVDDVETGLADVPFTQRRRSLRFARPLATHFMQWLIDHHAQLAIPAAARSERQLPAAIPSIAPAEAAPVRPQPIVIHEPREHTIKSGDVLTGPELARLIGLSCNALNHWARQQSVGAERNGWRLIGRGKRACGELGGLVPPGTASWLFQKV